MDEDTLEPDSNMLIHSFYADEEAPGETHIYPDRPRTRELPFPVSLMIAMTICDFLKGIAGYLRGSVPIIRDRPSSFHDMSQNDPS
jgi:hypothetical protein